MAVSAGDIRATMTLDTAGFSAGVAKAQAELNTLTAGGKRITNAFSEVESRVGASAAAIAQAMREAGQGSASLTEAAARADSAAAKMDALGQRAAEAAAKLAQAQAAATESGNALALLESSAAASAENLAGAQRELAALQQSGSAAAAQLQAAADSVQEFSSESAGLAQAVETQRAAHEANSAAAQAAEVNYRCLSAQLLGAEAAAEKADEKFAALADTVRAGGQGGLGGIVSTLTTMGTSTLTSASRSLGTIAVNAAGLASNTAAGTLAAQGLGDALRNLIGLLGSTATGYIGIGAAAAYAGYRIVKAATDVEDGADLWEKAYEDVDTERTTTMVNTIQADIVLDTTGLGEKVTSVYSEIEEALTDGEPDTQKVISSIQEATNGMFADVRTRIQTWYELEMAKLDLSTGAGLEKAAELTAKYDGLMDRVDALDESTAGWIASYAGKSTEECKEALTQLESYEEELERLARRADALTALLQSNQKAAYTAVSNGLTADDTSVSNALQYVTFDASLNLQYAQEDYDSQMAALWQEYQEKLQGVADEQEKLEIDAEYEFKIGEANEAYAQSEADLTQEYRAKLANVLQGAAEALSRSDPELGAAIEQAISGGLGSLEGVELDNPTLANIMKSMIESGVLEGVTSADLSTAEGQLQAMVELLGQGTPEAAQAAYDSLAILKTGGLSGLFGGVEADDFSAQIHGIVQEVEAAAGSTAWQDLADSIDADNAAVASLAETLDSARLRDALNQFVQGMRFEDADGSGIGGAERLVNFFTALQSATEAGALDAGGAAQYAQTASDLMALLDMLDPAASEADLAFLTELSGALNALGYETDAGSAVEAIHGIVEAYGALAGLESVEPEISLPAPEELLADYGGSIELPVEAAFDLPNPEELLADCGGSIELPVEPAFDLPDPEELLADCGGSIELPAEAALSSDGGGLVAAVEAMQAEVSAPLASVESAFRSAGDNAGGSFVSAVRSHIGAAAAAATAIGSAAYNALRASLSIHSPSRKMRQLGAYTGEGFALGISDQILLARQAISQLAGSTADAASSVVNNRYEGARSYTLNASVRNDGDLRRLSRQLARLSEASTHGIR